MTIRKVTYYEVNGKAFHSQEEALEHESLNLTVEILDSLEIDWQDAHPTAIAKALHKAGLRITKAEGA